MRAYLREEHEIIIQGAILCACTAKSWKVWKEDCRQPQKDKAGDGEQSGLKWEDVGLEAGRTVGPW